MGQSDSYKSSLEKYDRLVSIATAVSQAAANRPSPSSQHYWASVLFTRLCSTGMSLLFMLPRNRWVKARIEHWDFTAVASLSRNLIECYLAFFYLCVDKVSDDEWNCRWNLFNLHDCIFRKQIFEALGSSERMIEGFEKNAQDLHRRLLNNQHFLSLSDRQRKELLKGNNPYLSAQDELIKRMGEDPKTFRLVYRILSAQVHTLPFGFYRTGEEWRGTGLENPIERGYICLILGGVYKYILRGIRELIDLFPDISQKMTQADLNVIYGQKPETCAPKPFYTQDTSPRGIVEEPKKEGRIGLNKPCPCGSKKKYKKCCGK